MTSTLKGVYLRIQASLKTLRLTIPRNPDKAGLQPHGWEQSVVILDELGTSSIAYRCVEPKTAHLLILARAQSHLQNSNSVVTFLVVQVVPKVTEFPRYKRVGAGHVEMRDDLDSDPLELPFSFSNSVDAIVELWYCRAYLIL